MRVYVLGVITETTKPICMEWDSTDPQRPISHLDMCGTRHEVSLTSICVRDEAKIFSATNRIINHINDIRLAHLGLTVLSP